MGTTIPPAPTQVHNLVRISHARREAARIEHTRNHIGDADGEAPAATRPESRTLSAQHEAPAATRHVSRTLIAQHAAAEDRDTRRHLHETNTSNREEMEPTTQWAHEAQTNRGETESTTQWILNDLLYIGDFTPLDVDRHENEIKAVQREIMRDDPIALIPAARALIKVLGCPVPISLWLQRIENNGKTVIMPDGPFQRTFATKQRPVDELGTITKVRQHMTADMKRFKAWRSLFSYDEQLGIALSDGVGLHEMMMEDQNALGTGSHSFFSMILYVLNRGAARCNKSALEHELTRRLNDMKMEPGCLRYHLLEVQRIHEQAKRASITIPPDFYRAAMLSVPQDVLHQIMNAMQNDPKRRSFSKFQYEELMEFLLEFAERKKKTDEMLNAAARWSARPPEPGGTNRQN